MTTIFLDFETYFDSEYSLRKMPTPNYILDPRYETILVAVKVDDGKHQIIDGPDFGVWLKQFDPAKTTTITFNSLFDNSILAWRYGFVPSLMVDAMGLARATLGHELSRFSLASVSQYLQLGSKGTALANMLGKRREQIKAEGLWDEFCAYAIQDNVLCEEITARLGPLLPKSEYRVMDLVLRCCVEPRFHCDANLLREHLVQVREAKAQLLAACSIDQIKLMSAVKFQEALEGYGIAVKTKVSPTGKTIPQFARTDPFMAELLEDPNPAVAAMAAARIGFKSTIEETRAEKLLSIAVLPWRITSGLRQDPYPPSGRRVGHEHAEHASRS